MFRRGFPLSHQLEPFRYTMKAVTSRAGPKNDEHDGATPLFPYGRWLNHRPAPRLAPNSCMLDLRCKARVHV
ncbi:hypothetical protein BOTBODRAFT_341446 [Botryobasidium botryosum FD-172 SS1]|uniref:Uncharacterized protein n=1 Tax=Botryobasidium botryosum (strain FD-172 SS1) TaxID=930990 RepID=A0A067MSH7_BOTB1|nr:hypothetical protein BOTBODRAFT_341446 [Botryobasidium botryosum FD-172 SS1]